MVSGIIVVGGTRTAYIIDRQLSDGKIIDFQDYANYCAEHYQRIITDFISLGGTHVQIPVYGWQAFQRGDDYINAIAQSVLMLTNSDFDQFYRENNIQPYFSGLELLYQLPHEHPFHETLVHLETYKNNFKGSGDRAVIWGIMPIPILAITQAQQPDFSALNADEIPSFLYEYYSKIVYGVECPLPDFYIGSARTGQIKLRTALHPSIAPGATTKYYWLQYPTIWLNRTTLEIIMIDCQKQYMNQSNFDYESQMTPMLLEELTTRFRNVINDTSKIIGTGQSWNNL
ncbi:MAG: hypothetical protein AAFY41_02005 [Bacteroidota bacterium]